MINIIKKFDKDITICKANKEAKKIYNEMDFNGDNKINYIYLVCPGVSDLFIIERKVGQVEYELRHSNNKEFAYYFNNVLK